MTGEGVLKDFKTKQHQLQSNNILIPPTIFFPDYHSNANDNAHGVYGVVKHMTDGPYGYDEFSYGRITPTLPTPKATPSYKDGDDEWKIFSRRKSYSSGGDGRGDGYGQHRMSVTTSSSEVRRAGEKNKNWPSRLADGDGHTVWLQIMSGHFAE